MKSFNDCVVDYRNVFKEGNIQIAYKGLMEYMMNLKTFFRNKYPEFSVPGNLYQGYMDMTYFALFPEELKRLKLKIGIVLVHEPMKIEVWLAGINKQVQTGYWNKLKDKDLKKYRLTPTLKGEDSIIEHTISFDPDFADMNALTLRIECETLTFIKDIKSLIDG